MDLREGAIVDVVVASVEHYGVRVRFDDKDGVILVTNIYWDNDGAQKRMYESFQAGQTVRVKVLVVTPEQFSCSIKHLHPERDPWWDPAIYAAGAVHEGVVTLIFDNGAAIVKLPNAAKVVVESLQPGAKLNDSVRLTLTRIDVEKQRIEGRQV